MPYAYLNLVVSEDQLKMGDVHWIPLQNKDGEKIASALLEIKAPDLLLLEQEILRLVMDTIAAAQKD